MNKGNQTNEVPWCNSFTNLPSPAHLVIGASLYDEDKKGRDFYYDSHYYMMDIVHQSDPNNRYIKGDASNLDPLIVNVFCNKFDTIIFDWSVIKFIQHKNKETFSKMLDDLTTMLKINGKLIIDKTGMYEYGRQMNNFETIQQYNDYKLQQNNIYRYKIKQSIYPLEIKSYDELIRNNAVARKVYGPLVNARLSARTQFERIITQGYPQMTTQAFVITRKIGITNSNQNINTRRNSLIKRGKNNTIRNISKSIGKNAMNRRKHLLSLRSLPSA